MNMEFEQLSAMYDGSEMSLNEGLNGCIWHFVKFNHYWWYNVTCLNEDNTNGHFYIIY